MGLGAPAGEGALPAGGGACCGLGRPRRFLRGSGLPPSSSGACSRRLTGLGGRRGGAGKAEGGPGPGAEGRRWGGGGGVGAGVSRGPAPPRACVRSVCPRGRPGESGRGRGGPRTGLAEPGAPARLVPAGSCARPSDVNGGNGGGRGGFGLSRAESAVRAGSRPTTGRRGPTGGAAPGEGAGAGELRRAPARPARNVGRGRGAGAGRVTSRQPRPRGCPGGSPARLPERGARVPPIPPSPGRTRTGKEGYPRAGGWVEGPGLEPLTADAPSAVQAAQRAGQMEPWAADASPTESVPTVIMSPPCPVSHCGTRQASNSWPLTSAGFGLGGSQTFWGKGTAPPSPFFLLLLETEPVLGTQLKPLLPTQPPLLCAPQQLPLLYLPGTPPGHFI